MADNRIQIKRTAVAGRTANTTDSGNSQYITAGEFALNMPDGILYTSNGSALITVGSNLVNQNITGNLTVKAIIANGSIGTAGQVLTTNTTGVYWSSVGGTGTVTSVATGNGMTGGPVTTTGTVSILANTGIVANSTGTFVNASYIATLTANNTTFINGNNVLTVMQSLRANRALHGGGTITVSASGDILWSARFIVISSGRGTHFSTEGFFNIGCPTSGTITGVGGAANKTATAAGIPLAGWEALYYIMPIGSNSGSLAANFRVVSYTSDVEIPSDWLLICAQNNDNGNYYFNNGVILKASQSFVGGTFTSANMPLANNATNLGGVAAASYVQNTDSRTLSGNLVISGTSFTPSSNTILLGNSTQRWVLSANTGSFSGAVSGITTLDAGNTTITGFADVTTSVNSALFSVGTSFIANTTGAYHTGVVNAASHTVGTSFTANSTGVYTGNSIANVSITSQISTLGGTTVVPFIATIAANNSFSSGIVMRKIGNTTSSSGLVADNTELGYHGFSGWDGSGYQRGAYVIAKTSQDWSAIARGTNYQIYTTPNDTTTNTLRLHVDQSGNIGIGNATPSHRLRVEGDLSLLGGIHANGGIGTAGQVLHSDGTTAYWAADDQGVTSVATGNGLTGGTITATGTVSVLANSGIIANATGVFVNANNGLSVNSVGVHVVPGNGLVASNSTGVHVGAGNGITVNSTATAVLANTGIVANATGTYVNATYIGTISTTFDGVAGRIRGRNRQTGTTYTFAIGDVGDLVEGNNAAAQTYTVPPNSSVAFPVDTTVINIGQYGAGQITIAAGLGVTIRSAGNKLKLAGQYSTASLVKIGTDEWWLFGDLVA